MDTIQKDIIDNRNLINLKELTLQNILINLESRYKENKIYTKINQILLALNPFKKLKPIENEPHPDEIAIHCYNDMIKQNINHSILVSGESGAGKTETTKILLKKLLSFSSKNTKLLEQIYWSNYILEAFGNAKTIRNHNSSRFGKFINIYFQNKEIIGAKIETYLLEKIRVTNKSIDERNFHIFYMLFPDLVDYQYIKTNNLLDENLNDEEALFELHQSFKFFNISDETYLYIKNIIHSIILFSDFQNNYKNISKLLNIQEDILLDKINFQFIKVGKEIIKKPLEKKDIKIKIETLSNELYSKLFDYLVLLINKELSKDLPDNSDEDDDTHIYSISLLDIFGFEILQNNSIEQLCINYTNEILQHTFNKYFFQKEQQLYISEGLPFDLVKFTNNDNIIFNIENIIFNTIDETTKFIKGNSSQIISKLFENKNEIIKITNLQRSKCNFNINHYAESVEYDLDLFLSKNKLNLPEDIIDLLSQSENNIIKNLSFTKSKDTLLQSFKKQILLLKNKINNTQVNFIRCIKPNDKMLPLKLDKNRTQEQLKYNGVIEAIRVARQGYPIRIQNNIFLKLYGIIPKEEIPWLIQGKNLTFLNNKQEIILEQKRNEILNNKSIIIQKNYKSYKLYQKYKYIKKSIIKIQSFTRMFIQQNIYKNLLQNYKSKIIQKNYRMYILHKKYKLYKFINIWIKFRLYYNKIILQRKIHSSKIIIRFFKHCIFYNNIFKLIKSIQNIKNFFKIIQSKKILKNLKLQAKDLHNIKNKNLQLQHFIKQQNIIKQQETDAKQAIIERLMMEKEEFITKQFLLDEKLKKEIDNEKQRLAQIEKKNLEDKLEKERLEKENLNQENLSILKNMVEKDMIFIEEVSRLNKEMEELKLQLKQKQVEKNINSCVVM